jgi:hypothetical protein
MTDDTIPVTFTLNATLTDLDILTEMQRAGGHATFESIAAHALLLYARHLAIGDIPLSFLATDREARHPARRASRDRSPSD